MITVLDEGWHGWADALDAKGGGPWYVNDIHSVWLALAPALNIALEDAVGEAERRAQDVYDRVQSENLGRHLTPEFVLDVDRTMWNPTSDSILLLKVLDVFGRAPDFWWEREIALTVLQELGVDFGGLDLNALGISANAVRDAMMVVMESRTEMSFDQGLMFPTKPSVKTMGVKSE